MCLFVGQRICFAVILLKAESDETNKDTNIRINRIQLIIIIYKNHIRIHLIHVILIVITLQLRPHTTSTSVSKGLNDW